MPKTLTVVGGREVRPAQVADGRTDNQRRNRKRADTHQVHDGARREIAVEYPRWTPSSEHAANRSGVTRLAVVDFKLAEVERRLAALELALIRRIPWTQKDAA